MGDAVGSLFSAISGKFSSSLLIGTSLPVLLFLTLYVLVVEPVAPELSLVPATFQKLDTQWQVALITFGAALLTGLLYALNHLLILFTVKAWPSDFHEKTRAKLDTQRGRIKALGDLRDDRLTDPYSDVLRVLCDEYPMVGKAGRTRLANALLNAESYFKARYGIEHSEIWLRVAAVMDSPVASALDDQKAMFDFTLNTAVLAMALSLWLLIYSANHASSWNASLTSPFAWRIFGFALVSRLAYLAAVDRACALGKLIRAAVDLFRLKALKQMGFDNDYSTLADEKSIWSQLETGLEFPLEDDGPAYHRAASPPIRAISDSGPLPILRAVRNFHATEYPSMDIELTVTNNGVAAVQNVVIVDTLQASWAYMAGSAVVSAGTLTLKGTSPFQVQLPDIAAGTSVTVSYTIQCSKAGNP
jgi:hypothetical protein